MQLSVFIQMYWNNPSKSKSVPSSKMILLNVILGLILLIYQIEGLKCRTRVQIQQQNDFYSLVNICMKHAVNGTKFHDYSAFDNNQQPNGYYDREYENDEQWRNKNRPYNHETRGENQCPSFNGNEREKMEEDRTTRHRNRNYDNSAHRNRYATIRNRKKRNTHMWQKYHGKTVTLTPPLERSPIEDIEACVIQCIFKEMGLLNNEMKPDKSAVLNKMTRRIHDGELREFIEDSVDECIDIIQSDKKEQECESSKNLSLCLEERARRSCEDWEDENRGPHNNENDNRFRNRPPITNLGRK